MSVCPQIGPEPGSSHLLLALQSQNEVSKGTAPKIFEARRPRPKSPPSLAYHCLQRPYIFRLGVLDPWPAYVAPRIPSFSYLPLLAGTVHFSSGRPGPLASLASKAFLRLVCLSSDRSGARIQPSPFSLPSSDQRFEGSKGTAPENFRNSAENDF